MNLIKYFLFTFALISAPLVGMDKEPVSKKDQREYYRKLFALIDPKALEKLASQPFIPATPKTYFHFAPMIGNERHPHAPGTGSQEVELGTRPSWESTPETPIDVLEDRIRYLPADIKAKAFAHFEQTDTLLKGRITIDDAAHLAKLYQHEAEQRLKKEKPDEKKD